MIKKIKTKDLVKAAGSPNEAAAIYGIEARSIYQWKKYIPPLRAYELREFEPDMYYQITGQ